MTIALDAPPIGTPLFAAPRDDREDVLALALDWARAGRRVALATVVETWGSAPRKAGSRMVVDADGDFVGSVSGGCVEAAVIAEAADVIADGRPRLLAFGVADERAWTLGLACGGRIRVHLEPLVGEVAAPRRAGFDDGLDAVADLLAARRHRRPIVLATALDGGCRVVDPTSGDPLADEAARVLGDGRATILATPDGEIFLDPHPPAPRLVVVGAVHIAEPLIHLAGLVGFAATLVDPRGAFVRPARFPGATSVVGWPDDVLPALGLDCGTAVVALTHDPKIDDRALAAALASDAFYVGALGSRRTHERRLERLAGLGLAPEALARVHAPIGLDIGAEGPAEIALAIVAEIVAARRGKGRAR